MAQNLAIKYRSGVDQAFTKASFVRAHCKGEFDSTGAKTVRIYSMDPVDENDYRRSGANRICFDKNIRITRLMLY